MNKEIEAKGNRPIVVASKVIKSMHPSHLISVKEFLNKEDRDSLSELRGI